MSYGHWWFCKLVDDEEVAELRPAFEAAAAQVARSPAQQAAYREWLHAGECIDLRDGRRRAAEEDQRVGNWFNEFTWIFNPEPFRELGEAVLATLDEDTSAGFLMMSNCAPVAVLWQALGAARAEKLPGVLGNLLIPADGVGTALAQVREAMAGLDYDDAIERGHALCGFRNPRSEVRPVLDLLPQGLERALGARLGFLAIARPEL